MPKPASLPSPNELDADAARLVTNGVLGWSNANGLGRKFDRDAFRHQDLVHLRERGFALHPEGHVMQAHVPFPIERRGWRFLRLPQGDHDRVVADEDGRIVVTPNFLPAEHGREERGTFFEFRYRETDVVHARVRGWDMVGTAYRTLGSKSPAAFEGIFAQSGFLRELAASEPQTKNGPTRAEGRARVGRLR